MAIKLTNLENPRTHTEYEDSYTFKIFFFEFMNFYSSLIYIAFFKGRFFDYPGDDQARRSEFFRLKNDICDPAGCLSELCIQLVRKCLDCLLPNLISMLYLRLSLWLASSAGTTLWSTCFQSSGTGGDNESIKP